MRKSEGKAVSPRDARLAVLAVLLAVAWPFVPGPVAPTAEEHHRTKQAAPTTVEPADSTGTELMWRWYKPFPERRK